MSELLRLLRLSLLLRLIPSGVFFVVLLATGNAQVAPLVFVTTALTLGVLLFVTLMARAGPLDARRMRQLLIAAICASAFEAVVPALFARAGLIEFPDQAQRAGEGDGPGGFAAVLIFSLIPAVLGSWLEGRRRVPFWVAISVGATAFALVTQILVMRTLQGQTPSDPRSWGVLVAQAIIFSVLCYFVAALADRQRDDQAQLERANAQLIEQSHVNAQLAAGRERMTLSRDLHDTVAHSLAALAVQINAIEAVLADPVRAKEQLGIARGLVRDGLADTRRAITGLRLEAVRDLGLGTALRRHIDSVNQRARVKVRFEAEGDAGALSDDAADALFRIAQEALNNVERHSGAASAVVTLRRAGDMHTLSVADDGAGFDTEALEADQFGIRGMRERAELIGAHLSVKSARGLGTTVLVSLRR
jgi:signal transduction histidine kinase